MITARNPGTPVASTPLNAKDASTTVEDTKPNNKTGDRNTVKTDPSKPDNTTQSKVHRQPGRDPNGAALPDPNTAGLLDDVRSFLSDYIVFPTEHDLDVVTLWTAHTSVLDVLDASPRLVLVSPEPACGKTRLLEMVAMLCPWAQLTYAPNVKKLRLTIEDNDDGQTPTVLVDEADAVFGTNGTRNPELRALINTSYRRGPNPTSGDGEDAGATTSWGFAPFAVAGLSGSIPATITSRAVTITMRPPGATKPAKTYQRGEVVERAGELRERLLSWGRHAVARLAEIDPTLPTGLRDRSAEIWQPLFAIAELAQGSWPKRARAACSTFMQDARTATMLSPGLQLLADIRPVFGDKDRMLSEELVAALIADPENLWSERGPWALDVRRLARELQPYGVRTRDMRTDTGRGKGYQLSGDTGLTQAWDRWLPHCGVDDEGQLADDVTDDAHVTDGVEAAVTAKEPTDQVKQRVVTDVTGVTDKTTMPDDVPADSSKNGSGSSTPVLAVTGPQPGKAPAKGHTPGDVTPNTPGRTARVEEIVANVAKRAVPETDKVEKQASSR